MSDKIKYLMIFSKMPKKKDKESWAKTVEYFAPDMYELLYGIAGKDAYKKVSELQPEIVWLTSRTVKNDLKKGLQTVQEIKQLSPRTAIFVIFDELDDEEAVFDEYIACGAFKCYTSPWSVNAIFHDMYVALNLE